MDGLGHVRNITETIVPNDIKQSIHQSIILVKRISNILNQYLSVYNAAGGAALAGPITVASKQLEHISLSAKTNLKKLSILLKKMRAYPTVNDNKSTFTETSAINEQQHLNSSIVTPTHCHNPVVDLKSSSARRVVKSSAQNTESVSAQFMMPNEIHQLLIDAINKVEEMSNIIDQVLLWDSTSDETVQNQHNVSEEPKLSANKNMPNLLGNAISADIINSTPLDIGTFNIEESGENSVPRQNNQNCADPQEDFPTNFIKSIFKPIPLKTIVAKPTTPEVLNQLQKIPDSFVNVVTAIESIFGLISKISKMFVKLDLSSKLKVVAEVDNDNRISLIKESNSVQIPFKTNVPCNANMHDNIQGNYFTPAPYNIWAPNNVQAPYNVEPHHIQERNRIQPTYNRMSPFQEPHMAATFGQHIETPYIRPPGNTEAPYFPGPNNNPQAFAQQADNMPSSYMQTFINTQEEHFGRTSINVNRFYCGPTPYINGAPYQLPAPYNFQEPNVHAQPVFNAPPPYYMGAAHNIIQGANYTPENMVGPANIQTPYIQETNNQAPLNFLPECNYENLRFGNAPPQYSFTEDGDYPVINRHPFVQSKTQLPGVHVPNIAFTQLGNVQNNAEEQTINNVEVDTPQGNDNNATQELLTDTLKNEKN